MNDPRELTADTLADFRPLLRAHCYRMLGHPQDADDAVQDTFVRALRGLAKFEGRAALQTWLVRIATNVCLDAIKTRTRRRRPLSEPAGTPSDPITFLPADEWIAPIPDAWVIPPEATPHARLAVRQSVRLAFIALLQALPARQRAAVLLADVLGWTAAEAADALDWSVAGVNSALQRARKRLGDRPSAPAAVDDAVLARYHAAFERFDIDALVGLLADDIAFDMPPIPLWIRGPAHVAEFLRGVGSGCEGSILVPTSANGQPAFAQYRRGGAEPWGIVVLDVQAGRIAGITTFLDVPALFPLFGMPLALGAGDGEARKMRSLAKNREK